MQAKWLLAIAAILLLASIGFVDASWYYRYYIDVSNWNWYGYRYWQDMGNLGTIISWPNAPTQYPAWMR
jgi:hypothetical protein